MSLFCQALVSFLFQILIVVPMVTALCDLIYTIVKSDVANYQYVTPSVLVVTMVS